MNVTRLRLANFKRFTDLTIDLSSCAGAPKLVLLVGANGSGRSSVFDAFEYLSAPYKEAWSGTRRVDSPQADRGDGGAGAATSGAAQDRLTETVRDDPRTSDIHRLAGGGGMDAGLDIPSDLAGYLKKDRGTDMSVTCTFGGGFALRRSNGSPATTSPPQWNPGPAFYGRSSLRTIPNCARPATPPDTSRRIGIARGATSIAIRGSRRTSSTSRNASRTRSGTRSSMRTGFGPRSSIRSTRRSRVSSPTVLRPDCN